MGLSFFQVVLQVGQMINHTEVSGLSIFFVASTVILCFCSIIILVICALYGRQGRKQWLMYINQRVKVT
jgi:hypothetical protein